MTSAEENKAQIMSLMECAGDSRYSDVKQYFQLRAIAYSLMWIAEELHEMNERYENG